MCVLVGKGVTELLKKKKLINKKIPSQIKTSKVNYGPKLMKKVGTCFNWFGS